MTYKSVLVPSNTGNTRRRRNDASVRTRVEAVKQCVLGTELKRPQRPQLNQASNDLEGIHRQSYFILPSGEHIPQVLLSNLATLPRFDRMTVQGVIDAQQPSKLQAVLSRHTSTTFVADSGPMCDYLLPPLVSFDTHNTTDYRIQAVPLRPKTRSFALHESAASNTAKSATCNGDILVLESFKNSTKAAFNVCKRNSILPSGISAPTPDHSSIRFPVQNVLSRGRETSREPETSKSNYTVLKDLGRTFSCGNSIAAETWQQRIIAEEEKEETHFHPTRALKSTVKGVDHCESDLSYGSGIERSYLSNGSFSDLRMGPQVFINYRDSCPSGNHHVLRTGCWAPSHRTSNLSFDMELPSASMQKRSADDTELPHFFRSDALVRIDGKGLMQWTSFHPSFKSWSSVIIKQHLSFPHRLPFLSPLVGQCWLFYRFQKHQHYTQSKNLGIGSQHSTGSYIDLKSSNTKRRCSQHPCNNTKRRCSQHVKLANVDLGFQHDTVSSMGLQQSTNTNP
ncbi:hypothetical protein BDR22DRAFT_857965 [Usnea florida]